MKTPDRNRHRAHALPHRDNGLFPERPKGILGFESGLRVGAKRKERDGKTHVGALPDAPARLGLHPPEPGLAHVPRHPGVRHGRVRPRKRLDLRRRPAGPVDEVPLRAGEARHLDAHPLRRLQQKSDLPGLAPLRPNVGVGDVPRVGVEALRPGGSPEGAPPGGPEAEGVGQPERARQRGRGEPAPPGMVVMPESDRELQPTPEPRGTRWTQRRLDEGRPPVLGPVTQGVRNQAVPGHFRPDGHGDPGAWQRPHRHIGTGLSGSVLVPVDGRILADQDELVVVAPPGEPRLHPDPGSGGRRPRQGSRLGARGLHRRKGRVEVLRAEVPAGEPPLESHLAPCHRGPEANGPQELLPLRPCPVPIGAPPFPGRFQEEASREGRRALDGRHPGPEASALESSAHAGRSAPGDHVHHPPHGVAPVLGRGGSPEDLDPLHPVQGNHQVQIEMAGLRVAHPHSVHQDQELLEGPAPDGEVRLGRGTCRHLHPGGPAKGLAHGAGRKGRQGLPVQHLDGAGTEGELGAYTGTQHRQGVEYHDRVGGARPLTPDRGGQEQDEDQAQGRGDEDPRAAWHPAHAPARAPPDAPRVAPPLTPVHVSSSRSRAASA